MKSNILILLLIPMTLFGSLGAVYFKMYSSKKIIYLLLGVLFYGLGAITNIFLLKELPLTIVFPANALTYVWVLILAKFFFCEDVKLQQIIGVIFIILGTIFLIYL
ncbi:EamA family transporter [Lysinibacillus telephonicus]|uniref:EamA family transporter n=1 Tax=Lysinibacillus telephonicus TaxID=1714840 RepID=UPI0031FE1B49